MVRIRRVPTEHYLWQQDGPLPDMSGLRYRMPRDMPRRISSDARRKTQTGSDRSANSGSTKGRGGDARAHGCWRVEG